MRTSIRRLAYSSIPLLLASAASAQVVTNGDFETGSLPPWTFTPDVSSEPLMVATVATFQNSQMFQVNPGHGGSGGNLGGNLEQIVALTAGVEYIVSGDLYIENLRTASNSNGGTITVSIEGQQIHQFFVGPISALQIVPDTFSVPYIATMTGQHTLQLRFTRTFRNTTPSIYHWADNIVMTGGAAPCYANCDGSTIEPVLNVDDFTCFINEYAAAQMLPHAQQVEHYANCDGSSIEPALNVDDFTCFINAYAAGCP